MGLMPDTIDRSITNGRYGTTVYTFSSRLLTLLLFINVISNSNSNSNSNTCSSM